MSALICGSMAFDTIMVFPDKFSNHLLPEQLHILNVCFLVPEIRREFGGCAGNIAYNLKLLGGNPKPMAAIGEDFAPYAKWMDSCGICRKYLKPIEGSYTAQAFITTDQDDNQITAFHPGAMSDAHQNRVADAGTVPLAIVAPDGRDAMIQHSHDLAAASIPFIFDPGQGLPMFDGAELKTFLDQASYCAVNDYESKLIQEKTGLSESAIAERLDSFFVTLGGKGSRIYRKGKVHEIPVVVAQSLEDPTGCGDAYRAGLLFGILKDLDIETTGRIASLLGSIKIAHAGTQNHTFSEGEFADRFKQEYGYEFS